MTQLACWTIPVRGGYVLRGDLSTGKLVHGAKNRRPEFSGWRIGLIAPEDATLVAEQARRPATLAIDYASRQTLDTPAAAENELLGLLRRSWLSLGLGVALLAVSGGHWAPALAGAWLLAGRRWLSRLLGMAARPQPAAFPSIQPAAVSAEPHAGLTEIAAVVHAAAGDLEAYGRAAAMARALELDDAALVYERLAASESPETLRGDTGVWVPRDAVHDPAALPAATPEPARSEPVQADDDQIESTEPAA